MNEVNNVANTTGSIVIVEMFTGILLTMIIVSIVDLIKNFKNRNKK